MSDPTKRRGGAQKPVDPGKPTGASSTGTSTGPKPAGSRGPLSIGDLARDFDISTRAIRFYESRGLISPHRQGANRVFDRADQQRLALILRTKNLGLSLEEISEHLTLLDAQDAPAGDLAALKLSADRQIASLTAKRDDLQATLKDLRRIRAAIEERQKGRRASGRN